MIGFRPYMFRKVTIIGVGLIGGSIGQALKKGKLAKEIVGLSQHSTTLSAAVKAEAIDHGYHDAKKAVLNADLVIIATPVSVIPGMLTMIAPHLKRGCVVTDVGSTKFSIVHLAQEQLPTHVNYVGTHPLAGSEKKGVENANPDLFENATCILTPLTSTNRGALERIKKMWTRIGAKTKIVDPEEHDKIVSYISHLPHVLAYSLINTIPNEYMSYAAQGFKDSTRIASSSPQLWSDICVGNSRNIIKGLDEMVRHLAAVRKNIALSDSEALIKNFGEAKKKRDQVT